MRELSVLLLSAVIGLPLAIWGANVTLGLIRRTRAISPFSAWVGRAGLIFGLALGLLLGFAVLVDGRGYFAPLAVLATALLTELIVSSQLRNGIKVWERRERTNLSIRDRAVLSQIEEKLKSPTTSPLQKVALRVQRSILRIFNLGSVS